VLAGLFRDAIRTSSAGRLYDAVAALLGLRQEATYEAQAAMQLEQAAAPVAGAAYPFALLEREALVEVDWRPAVTAVVEDLRRGESPSRVAGRAHRTLAAMVAAVAEWHAVPRVVLGGGCFQSAALLSLTTAALRERGFEVLTPRRIPPNDGGLAVGQAFVAGHRLLAGEA
jgi:hydrogenase maturation protein HypF